MPGPVDYAKIHIAPDQDMEAWWNATKDKRFLLPKCAKCGLMWWPPAPGCRRCQSVEQTWHQIKGIGELHSYIVVSQPIAAHMATAVPYVLAIVELPDGTNDDGSKTRIPALLLDDEKDVAIGLPVALAWDDHPSQPYKLPRWRITAKSAPGMWKHPG